MSKQKLNKMWNMKENSSVISVKKYLGITANLCVIWEICTQTERIALCVQRLSVVREILCSTCGMFTTHRNRLFINIFDLIQQYYGLINVDACSLKTHIPFTFLNWTNNGIKLQCVAILTFCARFWQFWWYSLFSTWIIST